MDATRVLSKCLVAYLFVKLKNQQKHLIYEFHQYVIFNVQITFDRWMLLLWTVFAIAAEQWRDASGDKHMHTNAAVA